MLIDSIFALAIILLLAGLMTAAMHERRKMSSSLADSRDATRLAEATLTALQTRAAPPAPPQGAVINIHPLPGSKAPAGMGWTSVQVELRGRSVTLIGLAPAPRAPATTREAQ